MPIGIPLDIYNQPLDIGDLVCDVRELDFQNIYSISLIETVNYVHIKLVTERRFRVRPMRVNTCWLRLAEPEDLF